MNFSVFKTTTNWLSDHKIDFLAENILSSTNEIAKQEAMNLKSDVKAYVAEKQTHGRGRNLNTWENSKDLGQLLISYSFAVASPPQPISAPLFGLYIFDAFSSSFNQGEFSLKAPNDIYLFSKKVCGILIESVSMGHEHRIVVGIGINVLAHPTQVAQAGHLSEKLNVTEEAWQKFLSALLRNLTFAAQECQNNFLSLGARERLLVALNKFPLLPNAYTGISPFGDLTYHDKTVSWREI